MEIVGSVINKATDSSLFNPQQCLWSLEETTEVRQIKSQAKFKWHLAYGCNCDRDSGLRLLPWFLPEREAMVLAPPIQFITKHLTEFTTIYYIHSVNSGLTRHPDEKHMIFKWKANRRGILSPIGHFKYHFFCLIGDWWFFLWLCVTRLIYTQSSIRYIIPNWGFEIPILR